MLLPAATVMPLRDAPGGGIEVLMLHKSKGQTNFGGMWVFPGGRIEESDADPDAPGDELRTARRAAARESLEEADLAVDPEDCVVYSHWVPPQMGQPKRYATWFFVVRASEGVITVDMGEIHDHAWVRPDEMLRRRDAGEVELAPPTLLTLHELATCVTVDEVIALAQRREPPHYETRSGTAGGEPILMWHGDAGYDSGDGDAPGARHRLWMSQPEWRLEIRP